MRAGGAVSLALGPEARTEEERIKGATRGSVVESPGREGRDRLDEVSSVSWTSVQSFIAGGYRDRGARGRFGIGKTQPRCHQVITHPIFFPGPFLRYFSTCAGTGRARGGAENVSIRKSQGKGAVLYSTITSRVTIRGARGAVERANRSEHGGSTGTTGSNRRAPRRG